MNSRLFHVSDGAGTPVDISDGRVANDGFDLARYEAEMRTLGTQLRRAIGQARAARKAAQRARDAAEHTHAHVTAEMTAERRDRLSPSLPRSLGRSIFRR